MNLIEYNYQQVVVVTTLIQWRYSTFLSLKQPLQSLTSSVDVCQVVNRCCHILQVLYIVTTLSCVLQDVVSCLVSTYEARELVVSGTIGILREIDALLDNSSGIFLNHCLTIANLEDHITLTQLKFRSSIHSLSIQSIDESLVVLIHSLSILILLSCHPSLLTSLTILLSDCLEVSTTSDSTLDRVSLGLSLSY